VNKGNQTSAGAYEALGSRQSQHKQMNYKQPELAPYALFSDIFQNWSERRKYHTRQTAEVEFFIKTQNKYFSLE